MYDLLNVNASGTEYITEGGLAEPDWGPNMAVFRVH